MEKASSLAGDWLFFERFNDGLRSFVVADVWSLILGLISCKQEMQQFQRHEHEVFPDLFRSVRDFRLLDLPEELPVTWPERADDLPYRRVRSSRLRLNLTHNVWEKEKSTPPKSGAYGRAVRPETCVLDDQASPD